mmetsp:Transcript_31296/g.61101  ORF Transcript_31296/g.61101 Transcript_31296/m.61101 type:complete len:504 (+) Transcript_31296:1279-2790(+)
MHDVVPVADVGHVIAERECADSSHHVPRLRDAVDREHDDAQHLDHHLGLAADAAVDIDIDGLEEPIPLDVAPLHPVELKLEEAKVVQVRVECDELDKHRVRLLIDIPAVNEVREHLIGACRRHPVVHKQLEDVELRRRDEGIGLRLGGEVIILVREEAHGGGRLGHEDGAAGGLDLGCLVDALRRHVYALGVHLAVVHRRRGDKDRVETIRRGVVKPVCLAPRDVRELQHRGVEDACAPLEGAAALRQHDGADEAVEGRHVDHLGGEHAPDRHRSTLIMVLPQLKVVRLPAQEAAGELRAVDARRERPTLRAPRHRARLIDGIGGVPLTEAALIALANCRAKGPALGADRHILVRGRRGVAVSMRRARLPKEQAAGRHRRHQVPPHPRPLAIPRPPVAADEVNGALIQRRPGGRRHGAAAKLSVERGREPRGLGRVHPASHLGRAAAGGADLGVCEPLGLGHCLLVALEVVEDLALGHGKVGHVEVGLLVTLRLNRRAARPSA